MNSRREEKEESQVFIAVAGWFESEVPHSAADGYATNTIGLRYCCGSSRLLRVISSVSLMGQLDAPFTARSDYDVLDEKLKLSHVFSYNRVHFISKVMRKIRKIV
jgi:hypothetical protein